MELDAAEAAPEPEDHFYRLDNSAVFMAAISGASGPFVYRFYCQLRKPVVLDALQSALKAFHTRFPYFFVALQGGVFWHYLDPVDVVPRVQRETRYPCTRMRFRHGRPLLRVIAYRSRIACELHHVVTDGTGASVFLRSLLVEYFKRAGLVEAERDPAPTDIVFPDQAVDPAEEEDSYAKYFRKASFPPDRSKAAFLLPGRRMRTEYRETIAKIPLDAILALAKSKKVTITELLTAVYMAGLQDIYEALPASKRRRAHKRIAVQVPVNLRKIYPSRTLRNFFLFTFTHIDTRLGHWEFDEILHRVHHQMRLGLEEKELIRQIRRNVGGERNVLGRPVLLPLKTVVLRIINLFIGVGSFSGSLSNLGPFIMPAPYDEHIKRFGFLPSRANSTGLNIGVFSWKKDLYIELSSRIWNRDFEQQFFSRLTKFGLAVYVESSIPYTKDGGTEL